MARRVTLVNDNNEIKSTYVGWSWTIFFFESWPMLFRGNVGAFFGWGLLWVISWPLILLPLIISIVLAATWNNNQTIKLIILGFKPISDADSLILKMYGIGF